MPYDPPDPGRTHLHLTGIAGQTPEIQLDLPLEHTGRSIRIEIPYLILAVGADAGLGLGLMYVGLSARISWMVSFGVLLIPWLLQRSQR
ncbi:hypothetical protein GCM10009760_24950 [Kitasatospora kazusensis]|uniref:Uncharacterized protein n=1 Tax=Kitasatospora kazusensis TaxID=407974 RepID=A0ABN2ZEQ1_9ACTN